MAGCVLQTTVGTYRVGRESISKACRAVSQLRLSSSGLRSWPCLFTLQFLLGYSLSSHTFSSSRISVEVKFMHDLPSMILGNGTMHADLPELASTTSDLPCELSCCLGTAASTWHRTESVLHRVMVGRMMWSALSWVITRSQDFQRLFDSQEGSSQPQEWLQWQQQTSAELAGQHSWRR